jgi:hypothetical protein
MKMTAARATGLDFHARWRVETHGFLRMTVTGYRALQGTTGQSALPSATSLG